MTLLLIIHRLISEKLAKLLKEDEQVMRTSNINHYYLLWIQQSETIILVKLITSIFLIL